MRKHIHHFIACMVCLVFMGSQSYGIAQELNGAEPQSPTETAWQTSAHSRSRILIGDQSADGSILIGLDLTLDPPYKTYWRSPGDSGFAPIISTQGSTNIASIDVRWPVPRRFSDASGVINGYEKSLILPILIKPHNENSAITLHFTMDYGVCHTQCVPTHVKHTVLIPALKAVGSNNIAPSVHSNTLNQALKRTPQKVSERELARSLITNMHLYEKNNKQALRIDLSPQERDTTLFVEAPNNWVLGQPQRIAAQASFFVARNSAPVTFIAPIEYRPQNTQPSGIFRITLLSSGAAYEIEEEIDLAPKSP